MARLLRVFLHSDLRNGHEGLTALAKSHKIDVGKLDVGEYVIFINNEKNKIKLYAAHEVVAYLRLPKGRIDLRTIQLIPKVFEAKGKIHYDDALKEILITEGLSQ